MLAYRKNLPVFCIHMFVISSYIAFAIVDGILDTYWVVLQDLGVVVVYLLLLYKYHQYHLRMGRTYYSKLN